MNCQNALTTNKAKPIARTRGSTDRQVLKKAESLR